MTAAVISLASRQPRCLNCVFWDWLTGSCGWCEFAEELTNSDWHCPEFRRKEQANG